MASPGEAVLVEEREEEEEEEEKRHVTRQGVRGKEYHVQNITEQGRGCHRMQRSDSKSLDPSAPEFAPVWPLRHLAKRTTGLQPLMFNEDPRQETAAPGNRLHGSRDLLYRSDDLPLPCVACDWCFGAEVRDGEGDGLRGEEKDGGSHDLVGGDWVWSRDQLLRHLLQEHHIVIHQLEHIAGLRRWAWLSWGGRGSAGVVGVAQLGRWEGLSWGGGVQGSWAELN